MEEFPTPAFLPATLNVAVGDTVIWNWGGSGMSVESTTIPTGATPWTSGIHNDPHTFRYEVKVAGTYNYTCPQKSITGSFVAAGATSVEGIKAPAPFTLVNTLVSGDVQFLIHAPSLKISVYDLTGKLVEKWGANNVAKASFGTAALVNGMYLLLIEADNKRYSDKIVVQH